MKYIAYGSNMVRSQMAQRCPGAKLIGAGYLEGAQLEFYLHATVERSRIKDSRVPVVVWEITKDHEERLDRYEGFPTYYVKKRARVRMKDGSVIEGMVYVMRLIRTAPPMASYLQGIRKAYQEFGMEDDIDTVLEPAYLRSVLRPA